MTKPSDHPPTQYHGLSVSEGSASGRLYPLQPAPAPPRRALAAGGVDAAPVTVRVAFAAVAADRSGLAARLRAAGREAEAGIVEIAALIAADPPLIAAAEAAVSEGVAPPAAVTASAATFADAIAAVPDPALAARAHDVRQVADAVVAHLTGAVAAAPPEGEFILVGTEVDPAALIRLADTGLTGVVSVTGGANSHTAIIARGLGLPMLAGADPGVLAEPPGTPAFLDGTGGTLTIRPAAAPAAAGPPLNAALATAGPHPDAALTGAGAPPPAVAGLTSPVRTSDGQLVNLLCNVASAPETRRGLAAGAAGVGLLRTEIPFTQAAGWPSESEHYQALAPVMTLLAGKPAVVRLLDFSGDKVPPFLAGREAGLTALLGHSQALRDQLRAVLRAGLATQLAVMVPMVRTVAELARVSEALTEAAADTGAELPELGMMVEVASTAETIATFAPAADFLSLGTNDLTSEILGLDRTDPRLRPALAADPRVLARIAQVASAAAASRLKLSVCGDAAADPAVLPLLLGLGVRTFSVGAAAVRRVAGLVAAADTGHCADLAAHALRATSVSEVWAEVRTA